MSTSKFEQENIRSVYNTSLEELQKRLLNAEAHDTYHYIYTGKVLSNSDPLKQGRLKIQVINLFDELTVDEIPWAYPVQSFTDGSFSVPKVGQFLEVIFDHGDVYAPKYIGKAINLNQIPSKAKKNYPDNMVLYQTEGGSYYVVDRKTNKITIGNNSVELLDLISQLIDALITSIVPTAIGPQQLSKVTDLTIPKLQQKLSLLKGTV